MLFRLLGPVEVEAAGELIALPRRRERCLLGVLLLDLGRVVSVGRLAELLWDGEPPERARPAIHGHVSRLRTTLAVDGDGRGASLDTIGDGYRIRADPLAVDAHQFRHLLDRAAATGDLTERAELLRSALDLWRGQVLQDAATDRLRSRVCADLDERRLAAAEDLASASLTLRRERDVLPELVRLARAYPARERFTELHMRALYQSDRKHEALEVYRHARAYLADELGLDPSPGLRDLHQAILQDRLTIPAPRTKVTSGPGPSEDPPDPTPIVPRQLPADVTSFTGRDVHLDELDALLLGDGEASSVVITAIDGMAGVGKTALAVHAAHRLAERFPDGQLFIDLHGFSEAVAAVQPADALDRLLRALGVPGGRIPVNVDDRAALWRSVLAERRLLLVLDNAATEAQVVPLLPGAPGCLVLITSRRNLAGLEATHTVSLDMLPPADAARLFARTVGRNRLANQPPELVAETVELCGRLPLAIRVAAVRLRSHPAWSVADLVERLRDQRQRLAELADGSRSVTAALELSYQQLSADQQRIYRLLGLHPGVDLDPYAAAALAEVTLARAERLLDQLLDAHLLQEPAPNRYAFHDLVRAHAAHAAARDEPAGRAALGRLLDYYRSIAAVAMDAAYPFERGRRPRVPPADTPTPDLPEPARAMVWLDTELPNLLAVTRYAADHGWPEHTWHLSAYLPRHLYTRARHHDLDAINTRALTIARANQNHTGELDALNGLGWVRWLQGRFEPARHRFRQALEMARTIGNRDGELHALTGLGWVYLMEGRHVQAIDHYQRALKITPSPGHRDSQLYAWIGLGRIHLDHGQPERATHDLGQALEIARAIGHRDGEVDTLTALGDAHRTRRHYRPALDAYGQALEIARATGLRRGERDALLGLGEIHEREGRHEQAVDLLRPALDIALATGYRAAQIRAHDRLARAHLALDQPESAREHWQQALDILTSLGPDHTAGDDLDAPTIRAHLAPPGRGNNSLRAAETS